MSGSQRRVTRIVSSLLRRVLRTSEQTLMVVEAVRVVGWRRRLALGSSWAFGNRSALVFTDRRLLEVALGAGARTSTGDVREIVWNPWVVPRIEGRTLHVGDRSAWWLRHPVAAEVVAAIEEAAALATRNARRGGAVQQWRLCSQCGATMRDGDNSCQRCGARRPSERLARFLSLAIPGGGMLYLGRRGYAVMRMLTEIVVWSVFFERMLRADDLPMRLAVAAIGLAVLGMVKMESVFMTRLLAERAGVADSDLGAARWVRRGAIGLLASVVIVALPLLLEGSLSTRVTGDLAADAEYLGWSVSRTPGEWHDRAEGLRAVWRHDSGLELRATARPLAALTSARRAKLRWVEENGGAATVEAKRLGLGCRQVLRVVERVEAQGQAPRMALRYLIIDDYGRDEHCLKVEVASGDLEEAEQRAERLLSCFYWIPAVTPEGADEDGS